MNYPKGLQSSGAWYQKFHTVARDRKATGDLHDRRVAAGGPVHESRADETSSEMAWNREMPFGRCD
jgi:hypothetical protein